MDDFDTLDPPTDSNTSEAFSTCDASNASDPTNASSPTKILPCADPMMASNVRELIRPFDPISAEAETRYDDVARRINRVRAKRLRNDRERLELERQFVENDLVVRAGMRAGLPLGAAGRRQRIRRLFELTTEAQHLSEEEQFSVRALDRMNAALDRWARETYDH